MKLRKNANYEIHLVYSELGFKKEQLQKFNNLK